MKVRSKAKITAKGQITLPLAVRQRLGVAAGDVVCFELTSEGIQLQRDREPGVFERWAGRFRSGSGQSAAEIDSWLRGLRGHDNE